MTALSTVSPRYASASVFSFWRIIALISGGEYCLPPASTRASPFGPLTTLNGTIVSSSFTSACLRPMKRLIEKTVFSGFVTAWRFATVPTRRSPLGVNATTDGVVRAPSAFSITTGSPPSRIAMHEFVVIKADGSVMVHSDAGGYKPENWMTPPTVIEESPDSIVVRRRGSEDRLDIRLCDVLSDVVHDMGEAAALEKDGVERHLQELLADAPEWCGEGEPDLTWFA